MPPRKIKILFVIIDLVGGAGVFCRNLSVGLRRHYGGEVESELLMCRRRGLLTDEPQNFDRIHLLDIPVGGVWNTLRAARRIGKAINCDIRPDVVISVHTFANLLVPIVAPRVPVLMTVHTHLSSLMAHSRSRWVLKPLLQWRLPGQRVVAPSRAVEADLRENFLADRTEVIPHGVDIKGIQRLAREPVNDRPNVPYFLACGRLSRAKDYPTLLRAYALARQQGLQEELAIVGDGEERAALESLAQELSLLPHVHFLGHRDNPYPYFAEAKFFVLSSISESFGLVLPEAMALGLPIVATNCPGGPTEILRGGRDGLLVPISDPPVLATAMLQLSASTPLRETLAGWSRERVEDFSLKRMTVAYYLAIRRTLGLTEDA